MRLRHQVRIFQGGTRRHNAGHCPFDKALGRTGVLYLITYGDFVSFFHQLTDISFRRMPGDAAHGDAVLSTAVAAGQGELQLAGRHLGILEKHLVKIPHAIEQQSVRIFSLNLEILFIHGCQSGLISLFHGGSPKKLFNDSESAENVLPSRTKPARRL